MANSLRTKLKKLKHDSTITEEQYQELIKKLNGHDKKIIANTIDEFAYMLVVSPFIDIREYPTITKIAKQLKEQNNE